MRHHIGRWRALANAGFALAVLALGGFGLYQVAVRRWHVQPTFHVRARFATISGLEAGQRVRFQGMDAGVVERIVPPGQPGEPVELVLRIDLRLRHLVRTDTVARIMTEGMVGSRLVELMPGRPETPLVSDDGLIGSERPIELTDLLAKAGGSLQRLDEVAQTAEQGLKEITAVAASVREGKGSLGKLVQDDMVYQGLVNLTHQGERTVTALEDNLTALKHTWPLSRHFDNRAYYEREKVLYQPGAARNSRSFRAEELFEPERAVLTPVGRLRLDEVGRWFKKNSRPKSEVVIAAFTDHGQSPDLAEVLTQEQADTVRKYLEENHGIRSAGWFRTRKVAAVGFGTQGPRFTDESTSELPPRRVEIILFTPQT